MTDNSKRQPADRTRALAAIDLRTTGASYRTIAEQLGYRDASGAYRAVARLLTRREAESVGELRTVEAKRLDEMQAGLWDKAKAGNLGAVREVIRIMERRARLFGMDAPVSVTVEGISETEFARRAAELLAVTGYAPLLELAQLPPAPSEPVVAPGTDGWAADGWSNLGTDSGLSALPGGESIESDSSATVFTDDDLDDEDQADEEIVAEIVDAEIVDPPRLPPSQKRIPASEVLDSDGVPLARAGIARRIGGYDPTYHWRP